MTAERSTAGLRWSDLMGRLTTETAFQVLARIRQLEPSGKQFIKLHIGDSPFTAPAAAKKAATEAIQKNQASYVASAGLDPLRQAVADMYTPRLGVPVVKEQVTIGPGAKIFQQLFCEACLDPGDGVLVFSPYFPTYLPNIERRSARITLAALSQEHAFRPPLDAVEDFCNNDPKPKAIFLNSPHNPTGGVAAPSDLDRIAELALKHDLWVFSDEPYEFMVWRGKHESILTRPGMLERTVAAYTFSKSYSMSGYRLGYTITSLAMATALGNLTNTTISCVPPFVQAAGTAALLEGGAERDENMAAFAKKVKSLAGGLDAIPDVACLIPDGTFYAFANVKKVCNRLGISSPGLASFLLEGADDAWGVSCLAGDCFGEAGAGFLRFSCAESDDRIEQGISFTKRAFADAGRVEKFLGARPDFRLKKPY